MQRLKIQHVSNRWEKSWVNMTNEMFCLSPRLQVEEVLKTFPWNVQAYCVGMGIFIVKSAGMWLKRSPHAGKEGMSGGGRVIISRTLVTDWQRMSGINVVSFLLWEQHTLTHSLGLTTGFTSLSMEAGSLGDFQHFCVSLTLSSPLNSLWEAEFWPTIRGRARMNLMDWLTKSR